MKKKLTTLLLLACVTITFGQSIHILYDKVDMTGKTITVTVCKDSEFVTELALKNVTSSNVDYQVNRTILNPPLNACSFILFCTGLQCYGPNNNVTWTPKDNGSTIKGNETLPNGPNTYGIAAHYKVCETACADLTVLYRVYKTTAGSKDTATITIKYTCTNGITEGNLSLGTLSDAYPNPTHADFSVNYSIPQSSSKNEIVMYDLFGKKVLEATLPKNEGTYTANTSSLTPGVYFYTLLVNNQRAVTKRLVISE